MAVVNKLASAIQSLVEAETEITHKFAWNQAMDLNTIGIKTLKIIGMESISIPINLEDVERIFKASKVTMVGSRLNKAVDLRMVRAQEIDGSKFIDLESNSIKAKLMHLNEVLNTQDLLKLVVDDCDVEMNLDKLVLYEAGGHFKCQSLSYSEKSRAFAKIILKIPVEGGHEGGRLLIFSSDKSSYVTFERATCSDLCYLTTYYADCHPEMLPITKGNLVTLEFSLVSSKFVKLGSPSLVLPKFHTALEKAKESLQDWADWKPPEIEINQDDRDEMEVDNVDAASEFDLEELEEYQDSSSSESSSLEESSEESDSENNKAASKSNVWPSIHWSEQLKGEEDDSWSVASSDDTWNLAKEYGKNATFEETETDEESYEEIEEDDDSLLPTAHPEMDSEMGSMFVIPLRSKFVKTNPSFESLTGSDLLITELFQSINFVDVHLAIIAQCFTDVYTHLEVISLPDGEYFNDHDCENQKFWVEKWIDGKKSVPRFAPLGLDMKNHLVGKMEHFVKQGFHLAEQYAGSHIVHYYAALIIQPRRKSMLYGCRYHFEDVLNHLISVAESVNEELTERQFSIRNYLKESLRELIEFCRKEPFRVWNEPLVTYGDRARRLLHLCTLLKAEDEGLELLGILGSDYELDSDITFLIPTWTEDQPKFQYEGIRNVRVAEAIVEFESQVSGWKSCSNLILNLIQPCRLVRQLTSFTSLILGLQRNGCIDGVLQVTDRLSSLISEIDFGQPQYHLEESQINSYVDMVVALEVDERTADPQRISQLFSFYRSLQLHQQCRLLMNLEKNSVRFKGIPSCVEFYRHLYVSLVSVHFPPDSRRIQRLIVRLIQCYSRLGDDQLLVSLVDNILKSPSEADDSPCNGLREAVLMSSWIWQHPLIVSRITASSLAKSAFYNMIDARLVLAKDDYKMLGDCLRFVILMGTHQQLADPWRLETFSSVVAKLPNKELAYLINGLTKEECNQSKKKNSNSDVFSFLSRQSLSYFSSPVSPATSTHVVDFLEILKRLVWLEKKTEFESALSIVCDSIKNRPLYFRSCWSNQEKSLIQMILTSPDVLGDLDWIQSSFLSQSARQLFTMLTETWIVGIDSIFERPGPGELPKLFVEEQFENCIRIFIRAEKKWPRDPINHLTEITPNRLIPRLSFHFLLDLIAGIYQSEVGELPNLKEFPLCLELFRNLCRRCLVHRHYDESPSLKYVNSQEILLKSLFWIDDGDSLIGMCRKLCVTEPGNSMVEKIVNSGDFRQLASTASDNGRAAFCLLLDYRINSLKAELYPVFSWSRPEATCPDYPEIETFLRSSLKEMTYGNFTCLEDTKSLMEILEIGKESLDIELERKRKQSTLYMYSNDVWEIVIVKNGERLLIPTCNQKEILNAELVQLTSLRQRLEKSQLS